MSITTNKPKTTNKFYCSINSKTKMIVWFKDGNTRRFYSQLRLDAKSQTKGIEGLEKMLFSAKFKNQWKTAIIYKNELKGPILRKWVDGKRM